jgi:catechol 2,3-dioxygenase-like lactoylglutathione lyase family enzyme
MRDDAGVGSSAVAVTGAHVLLYTSEPDALRAAFRDVFGWRHVDDGDGWLIFALPPAELGVHPSEGDTRHELSLMCDDIAATVEELRAHGVQTGEPEDLGFGVGTTLELPGGVRMLLYEPRHGSPLAP